MTLQYYGKWKMEINAEIEDQIKLGGMPKN